MIRSNAEIRSVVTNSRRSPSSPYDTLTLPTRRSGRGRSTSVNCSGNATASPAGSRTNMAHRRREEAEAERVGGARPVAVTRMLAPDDVVLGVRHESEHESGDVAHPRDVGH